MITFLVHDRTLGNGLFKKVLINTVKHAVITLY